ncbi:hypothetical protein BN14_10394 [Rhizoctonia solani AG-1 IB]|uniref:Uncharacterized protein n=1 Tax=Thanatephorus cucumeris (strain AG1-IB / isolate 7/3/14) TaxID=1108050 RepID=M5C8F3_THACB|nr:hypothetical protein BN14_10394 [Rhizoctonia solani AG-1 IB]
MTTLQYHVLKGNYWTSYHFDDFMNYLEIWGAYSVGLQNLRTLKYPSQDPSIRRLFGLSGISATDASTLVVPNRSQLSDLLNKSLVKNKSQEKTRQLGVKVHTGDVDAHIQNFFASQARKEIFSLSSSLLGSYQAQFVPTSPHDTDKNIPQSISLILSTLDSVMTREHNSDGSVFTSADEEKIRITWSMRLFSLVFLPNGSVGVLKNYQSMNIAGVSGISMHLWINKLLQLLDPWEQDRAFVTLFIACVALAFEFQSTGACPATALPLRIKKNGRPMRRGCPKEPDRFTDDIVKFFQRHSEWRIVNMNKCLKFWAILFILVNLHSSHESTRYIQDVLVKLITQIIEFEDTFREGFQFLGFSMSCLPAITAVDRISVLSNIHRVYRQEDVVMLRRGKLNTHSDTSSFTGNIIEFNTLTELHVTLTHASDSKQDPKDRREDLESSSKPVATVDSYEQEEPNIHTIGQNSTTDLPGAPQSDQLGESGNIPIDSVTLSTRPDTPVSIANSEVEELLENHGAKPKMSHEDAALLILRAWRRSLNREEQKQRLSDFDPAGRMYQQYHPYFPRCGAKASERDKLGLRLIRGPCIEIAIGLRAISEEIDIYSEILNDDIHAPGLTLAQVASTQESIKERRKKAEGYKQKVLACCPLDAPAKVLIAKNLAGVKTQTKNAWDAFMVVKNSGILQQSEGFKKAAALVSRGRDLILDATKL